MTSASAASWRFLRSAVLLVALLAGTAAAEPPALLRPGANPDVLRLASLPFEPGDAMEVEEGQWRLTASLNYANLWNHTHNLVVYRRQEGYVGRPVSSEELAAVAERHPGEWFQFLDVEAWWAQVWVQRGLGRGVTLTLQVPFLDVGRPHWDAIAERWHQWLDLPDFNRHEFPRGETRGG